MGGECDTEMTANTAEEMATKGMEHVKTSHPDMAAKIVAMTPEETAQWMTDFKPKFDAAPTVA